MTRDERIEAAFSAYNHALARLGRQIRPRDFLGAIIDAAYPELAAGTHWIAPREMTMKVTVKVRLKSEVLDPQGDAVGRALGKLGFAGVRSVRVGKLIELDVDDAEVGADWKERLASMADEMLANPVIEDYEIA